MYINHDPVMTLTKFMARSTWVAHAFEWEKLLKCHLKGKTSKKLANGQNIDYSEKRKRPKGFICPCTGVKYHNIQTCLLVHAADSGERLQDHWSSGVFFKSEDQYFLELSPKVFWSWTVMVNSELDHEYSHNFINSVD